MQILSIRLKNVKSHRDAEFAFSPGINVLAGPNGVGKSTVFEAIGYALFGVDARDFVGRADRFITLGAKRGEVAVVFRDDAGALWQVTRTVGANPRWLLALERDGTFEVEEHAGSAETETRLREILGLDHGRPLAEQFRQVIGPLQNDFLGPFVLRGSKRQEAFDQILGIDGWRRTFEGTLALQKAIQHRVDCLEAEIAGRAEQIQLLPLRQEELGEIRSRTKEKERILQKEEKALAGAEKELAEQDGRRKALEAAENELRVLAERIENGTSKVAEARVRVTEAESASQMVEESRAGKEAFDQAEAELKDLRTRERQRQEAERSLLALEKDRDRIQQQTTHEEREIAEAARHLLSEEEALDRRDVELQPDGKKAALAARLPELGRELDLRRGERALLQGKGESLLEGQEKLSSGVCPFLGEACGNLTGSDLPMAGRLREIEEEVGRLQGRIAELEGELREADQAEKALAALEIQRREVARQRESLAIRKAGLADRERKLAELRPVLAGRTEEALRRRKEMEAFAGLEEAIAAAEARRDKHREARDRHHAHLAAAGEMEVRRRTLLKYEAFLATLQEQKKEKSDLLQGLRGTYDPAVHEGARRDRDHRLGGVAALRQEVKGLAETATRLESEIESLLRVEAEVAAKKAEIGRLGEKGALVRFLRSQVFNQVSARLSERFREEISRRADRIYRTIAEADEELAWGEGYQVTLRDLQDGQVRERTDDQLSGGQTMSAVVALRLALLQTIGARIAFFDEPTSNLDADRRENLARAFRAIDLGREEVTRHWYDQLFLVSHDTAFAEITDQVIEL